MLAGLMGLLEGWARPRWRSGEYELFDLSIFTGLVALILYLATPTTVTAVDSTVVPSELLTLLGITYGSTQSVLGGLIIAACVVSLVLSFRPDRLVGGFRILFTVSSFWAFMLLLGVVVGSAPPRNLVVVLFFTLVASHLARHMPDGAA